MVQPLEKSLEEINKWLDYKHYKQSKRELRKVFIDILAEAMSDGDLVLDDNMNLTYTLSFPIAGMDKLTFKPLLTIGELQAKLSTVKATDLEARGMAYISTATGVSMGELAKMNTVDSELCTSIVNFFS
jgi:hypothetical protein